MAIRRWRRRAERELDLLAVRSVDPTYDFATERLYKRWRRCVITTTELQDVAQALTSYADTDLWLSSERFAEFPAISFRKRNATIFIRQPVSRLDGYLKDARDLAGVNEVKVVIGDSRQALVVLVFQKRRPGVWTAIEGLVDEVPEYGDAARMLLTKLERLLDGKASSPWWSFVAPGFIAPGLRLRGPNDPPPVWPERLSKSIGAVVGTAALAIVGWITKEILDGLFG